MRKKLNLILLIIILLLSGCNNYDVIEEDSYNYPPINPLPNEGKLEVTLFYPNQQLTHLVPEIRIINSDNNDLSSTVIEELFKGTDKKGLVNIIPKSIKFLSVDVLEGTAYVNLSSNLKDNNMSEKEEAFILYSIVNTLCKLGNINSVQILLDGQMSDRFINVYSIKEPLSYSSLIVEEDYINLISVIKNYYNSITSNDFGSLLKQLNLNDHDYLILGMIKAEFGILSKYIDDFQIKNYVISRYNYEIEVTADIILYDYTKLNNVENTRINRRFDLKYENNDFKVTMHVF